MPFRQAWYRCGQFARALEERNAPRDSSLLAGYLDGAAIQAFTGMSARDQTHSIRTARAILRQPAAERDLVIAALLHDVGKGQQQLWHRVAYVLLSRWSPRALQQLARPDHGWRAALVRLRDHPLLGAAIARSLGYNETVCQLIEKHHSGPEDSRHRALQRADEVA